MPSLKAALAMLSVAGTLSLGGDDAVDMAVHLAREALARQLRAATDPAVVVAVTAVDWPDSSLGCPRAGLVYQPVITPGHRVVLRLDGSTYTVHVGAGHAAICGLDGAAPDAKVPEPGSKASRVAAADAALGLKLAQQARSALATRLDLPRDRVTIDFYRPAFWPDAALGCPHAGDLPEPQPTKGFRIQLSAGGRSYEFHSDLSRVIECSADGATADLR